MLAILDDLDFRTWQTRHNLAILAERAGLMTSGKFISLASRGCDRLYWLDLIITDKGVVCGRGRNPTLRLWPTIFSGKIDVFRGDRRSRLISSMTSVAPA